MGAETQGPSQSEVVSKPDLQQQIDAVVQVITELIASDPSSPRIKKGLLQMMQLANEMGSTASYQYLSELSERISALRAAAKEAASKRKEAEAARAIAEAPGVAESAVEVPSQATVQPASEVLPVVVELPEDTPVPQVKRPPVAVDVLARPAERATQASGPSLVAHANNEVRSRQLDSSELEKRKKEAEQLIAWYQPTDRRSPHQILGVSETLDSKTVRKAYLKLTQRLSPDALIALGITDATSKRIAGELMQRVNGAYDMAVALIETPETIAARKQVVSKIKNARSVAEIKSALWEVGTVVPKILDGYWEEVVRVGRNETLIQHWEDAVLITIDQILTQIDTAERVAQDPNEDSETFYHFINTLPYLWGIRVKTLEKLKVLFNQYHPKNRLR